MNNKEKKDIQFDIEAGEDVTVYGEFVASYFAWLPPERQKQRAKAENLWIFCFFCAIMNENSEAENTAVSFTHILLNRVLEENAYVSYRF